MNYFQPLDLNEALQFLSQTKLRIAAGCTDILPTTEKNELSGNILDISKINSLKGITTDNNYRKIGALTTWSDINNHKLPNCYQMLKDCSREMDPYKFKILVPLVEIYVMHRRQQIAYLVCLI